MVREVIMPQLGLTMEEGTIVQWIKQEGDTVKAGDVLLEITTDKLTSEVVSEYDGTLLKIVVPEGEDVPVKGLLAYIGDPSDQIGEKAAPAVGAEDAPAPAEKMDAAADPENQHRIRISPLARKTAAELGVDYAGIAGSGSMARIVQKDILAAFEAAKAAKPEPIAPAPKLWNAGPADGGKAVKISGMRKVVAQRMLQAHTEIPPVTQVTKVDVTELMAFRKMLLEETGKKYSVNDLILKATARVLRSHPEMLASLVGEMIVQHDLVHLGMAVALDAGLIVPVIRDADLMGLDEISLAARDIATRAKENRLLPDEYNNSTFTVTNLGMFGVEMFTPIINQPNAAILGVCAIEDELAQGDDGGVEKHQVMRLCLTYDHRLIDGAVAARFAMDLRDMLQKPIRIIL